jgi:hypothetical protein
MDDLTAVLAECHAAQAEGREISDACARTIGAMYHNGQASPGYSFASTGAISDPTEVWRDLFGFAGWPLTPREEIAGDMLGTYLTQAGPRGPVPGWSQLWIR